MHVYIYMMEKLYRKAYKDICERKFLETTANDLITV